MTLHDHPASLNPLGLSNTQLGTQRKDQALAQAQHLSIQPQLFLDRMREAGTKRSNPVGLRTTFHHDPTRSLSGQDLMSAQVNVQLNTIAMDATMFGQTVRVNMDV